MLLLCEDGNVYQSYIKMPFSVEIKEFQLFRHAHIDETSFMIEEINEWPEGVNIRKGFISKQIRDIHIIKRKWLLVCIT